MNSRSIAMTDSNSDRRSVPKGWHSVTPQIVVHGAKELVFSATGEFQETRPSELWGDSVVMVSEAGVRSPMPAFLYVYVSNTEVAYERALKLALARSSRPSTHLTEIAVAWLKINGATFGKSPHTAGATMPPRDVGTRRRQRWAFCPHPR
jgi:hypothetical protein